MPFDSFVRRLAEDRDRKRREEEARQRIGRAEEAIESRSGAVETVKNFGRGIAGAAMGETPAMPTPEEWEGLDAGQRQRRADASTLAGDVTGTWKDIPVQMLETVLGSERLGVTGADVYTPTMDMAGNVASQLGQTIATLGAAGAPQALQAAGRTGNVARFVARSGETVAGRAGLGALIGAQSRLRTQGIEDPVGIATAAGAGAVGGMLPVNNFRQGAGQVFSDVGLTGLEVARTNPELAARAVDAAAGRVQLTDEERARLIRETMTAAVPSAIGAGVSVLGSRAARANEPIKQADAQAAAQKASLEAANAREAQLRAKEKARVDATTVSPEQDAALRAKAEARATVRPVDETPAQRVQKIAVAAGFDPTVVADGPNKGKYVDGATQRVADALAKMEKGQRTPVVYQQPEDAANPDSPMRLVIEPAAPGKVYEDAAKSLRSIVDSETKLRAPKKAAAEEVMEEEVATAPVEEPAPVTEETLAPVAPDEPVPAPESFVKPEVPQESRIDAEAAPLRTRYEDADFDNPKNWEVGNPFLDDVKRSITEAGGTVPRPVPGKPYKDSLREAYRSAAATDLRDPANFKVTPEMQAGAREKPFPLFSAGEKRRNPQVDTPEFKNWFGESKVKDKSGTPTVVYHGTTKDFSEFKPNEALGGGIFFSPDPSEAAAFSGQAKGASIIPVYIKAEKVWPKIIRSYEEASVAAEAKSKGYDAVRVRDSSDGVVNWLVFDPANIKSATGNSGAFDPANPDIRFSAGQQGTTRTTPAKDIHQKIASIVGDRAVFIADAPPERGPNGETYSGKFDVDENGTPTINVDPAAVSAMDVAREEAAHFADRIGLVREADKNKTFLSLMPEGWAGLSIRVNDDGTATVTGKKATRLQRLVDSILANDEHSLESRIAQARQLVNEDGTLNLPEVFAKGYREYFRKGSKFQAPTFLARIYDGIAEMVQALKSWAKGEGFASGIDVYRNLEGGAFADKAPGAWRSKRYGSVAAEIQGAASAAYARQRALAGRIENKPTGDMTAENAKNAARAVTLKLMRGLTPSSVTEGKGLAEAASKHAGRMNLNDSNFAAISNRIKAALADANLNKPQRDELKLFATSGDMDNFVFGNLDPADPKHAAAIEVAVETRKYIDNFGRSLKEDLERIASEAKDGTIRERATALANAVQDNLGEYMRRSYEVFTLPEYAPKLMQDYLKKPQVDRDAAFEKQVAYEQALQSGQKVDKKNVPTRLEKHTAAVEGFVREQMETLKISRAEAENNTRTILDNATDKFSTADDPSIEGRSSKGQEALERLDPNLSPAIRRLYGEFSDFEASAIETMSALHALDNTYSYMKELKNARRPDDQAYFSQTRNVDTGHTEEVPSSLAWGTLEGMYTDPDTLAALRDIGYMRTNNKVAAAVLKGIRGIQSGMSTAQLILNPAGQSRNALGSALQSTVGFGLITPSEWKAARAAFREKNQLWKEFNESGSAATQHFPTPVTGDVLKRLSASLRESENMDPGDMMTNVADTIRNLKPVKWSGTALDWARAKYLAGDQFWRMVSFIKAKEKYGSVARAAEEVNAMHQDYARIMPFFKTLQQTPLVAPYMSYKLDLPRTMVNALTRSPGSALRATVLMGMFGAAAQGVLGVLAQTGAAKNLTPEERELFDKSMASLAPNYERNGDLIPFKATLKGKERILYIDGNQVNPAGQFLAQVKGVTNPSKFRTQDFALSSPVVSAASILISGRDARGFERAPQESGFVERLPEAVQEVTQSLIPSLLPVPSVLGGGLRGGYTAERIKRGITGEADSRGRVENLPFALADTISPFRVKEPMPDADFQRAVAEESNELDFALREARRIVRAPGKSVEEKQAIIDELAELAKEKERKFAEIRDAFRAGYQLSGRVSANVTKNLNDAKQSSTGKIREAQRLIAEARAVIARGDKAQPKAATYRPTKYTNTNPTTQGA